MRMTSLSMPWRNTRVTVGVDTHGAIYVAAAFTSDLGPPLGHLEILRVYTSSSFSRIMASTVRPNTLTPARSYSGKSKMGAVADALPISRALWLKLVLDSASGFAFSNRSGKTGQGGHAA